MYILHLCYPNLFSRFCMTMYLQLRTTYYIYNIAITISVSHVLKFPCTVLVHARGRPENGYSPVHET